VSAASWQLFLIPSICSGDLMIMAMKTSSMIASFINWRRENPYFSLNDKILPCVGSERSE
jgi:hypothetical protein